MAHIDVNPESPSEREAFAEEIGIWRPFANIVKGMSSALSVIGVIGIVALISATTIDVIGSKVFNHPLRGFVGITEVSQLIAMSFGMGITFLGGHHIKVELLTRRLRPRAQAVMGSLISFLGLALFGLIIWRMAALARSFQVANEVIDQIYIPWYPFLYGMAIAFVPVFLALLFDCANYLNRAVRG